MKAGKIWRIVFDIKIKKHNKIKFYYALNIYISHYYKLY